MKTEETEAPSRAPDHRKEGVFPLWKDLPPPPPLPKLSQAPKNRAGILSRVSALVLLILTLPIFIAVAIAIKVDSPRGTVFYRQERVGLDRRRGTQKKNYNGPDRRASFGRGRHFMIWKFRTMVPDAEAKSGPVWATEQDPRITRVGRTLRKLRLDELPQLFNVVTGRMALIGPRPERPYFVNKLSETMPRYQHRLAVPPGITGLAQVEREYDSDLMDVQTKLEYDLFYVKNRSRMMDLKILLKTVDVVLRGRGAH